MIKYYKEDVAIEKAVICSKKYGGTWAVIKYKYDFGVEKLTSFIRIDPMLEIIFKIMG